MIVRVEHDKHHPYMLLNSSFLRDKTLGIRAKGVLGYMLSFPSDWQFYATVASQELGIGTETFGNIIKELINKGYCTREKLHGKGGRFTYDYTVFETRRDSTRTEKPGLVKPALAKPSLLSIETPPSTETPRSSGGTTTAHASRKGATIPKNLTSPQMKFCIKFKNAWEKRYGAKYTKRDFGKVSLIECPQEATRYIGVFMRDEAGDDYMDKSDHSLTVFVNNFAKLICKYSETREGLTECKAHAEAALALRTVERQNEMVMLAAEVAKNPLLDKWYEEKGSHKYGIKSRVVDVLAYLPDGVGDALAAERDARSARDNVGPQASAP